MATPIIEIKGISKRYRLGEINAGSFKEATAQWWRGIWSKKPAAVGESAKDESLNPRTDSRDFWALREISFDVHPGEVVGIIGKNGAGKSTLLKILSRITEPTEGDIFLRGRVASLLEVGTGFHAELSGRDNIFLNGAILGMTKKEISSKFDEIVAFAEVENFIDTPVKRYSSGMYVRLAFAVAAHLEPEILIVDEVLAVGDVSFQRKCLGKMHEISHEHGRTILFVSHNMNAVENLCSRCVSLKGGIVVGDGNNVHEIIRDYLGDRDRAMTHIWRNSDRAFQNEWFQIDSLSVASETALPADSAVPNTTELEVVIEGIVLKPDPGLQIGYGLFSSDDELIYWSTFRDVPENQWEALQEGPIRLAAKIPARFLNEGQYRVDLFLGLYHRLWIAEPGANSPEVHFEIRGGLSDSPFWIERRPGILSPVFPWRVDRPTLSR